MKKFCLIAMLVVSLGSLLAADPETAEDASSLTIEIPRLRVSEYHRPYVAAWIQNDKRQAVANLAVWYQQPDTAAGEGTKWLPDLRQWWRRSGRRLTLPIDGVSGATRAAGQRHTVKLDQEELRSLAPGDYTLMIEAAREVGGRELLEIEFSLPIKTSKILKVQGKRELGELTLVLTP